ncbi:MAG: hypothetical protein KDD61_14635 [Bdellovibrionales bacterium]|nr:hypothetical protein [Bdellovibrionales bacterium]
MIDQLILKLAIWYSSPVFVSGLGYYINEKYGVSNLILAPIAALFMVYSFKMFLIVWQQIAEKKRQRTIEKYRTSNYKQLKKMFIANPQEAAFFIKVRDTNNMSGSHVQLN